MTPFERRLARDVVGVWLALNILTAILRVAMRLMEHQTVSVLANVYVEWQAVVQAVAGAALAVYVWRSRPLRHRVAGSAAFGVILFALSNAIQMLTYIPLRPWMPNSSVPLDRVLRNMVTVDVTHFFILALGAVSVTLMIERYLENATNEREAARLEVSIADARMRHVRSSVQPEFIRQSIEHIETLLPHDPAAAEAALLNLSDFLRDALVRAKQQPA